MYYYSVVFGTGQKQYYYQSTVKMIIGNKYIITNDFGKTYNTYVQVVEEFHQKPYLAKTSLVTITKAEPYYDTKVFNPIKQVYYNLEKGTTTVKWCNDETTTVKLQPGDSFDLEKAIAMCVFKQQTDNRGAYMTLMRKAIENAIDSSKEIPTKKKGWTF